MKVIVGGTRRDYQDWLRDNSLSEREAIHVTSNSAEKLMGLELARDDIVRLGYLSPAAEELLLTRIRK